MLLGKRLAVVAGVFVIIVACIMALNAYLLHTVDPLNAPALQALATQLENDPDAEALQQQFRELDLLARRAFFVRQWQLEVGAILLAVGIMVFVVALFMITGNQRDLPDFNKCPGENDPWRDATRARILIVVLGLVLLAVSIVLTSLSEKRMGMRPSSEPEEYDNGGTHARASAEPDNEQASAPDKKIMPVVKPDFYWPAFRGPDGLGVASPKADPPTAWNGTTGDGIRWKTALPRPGTSAPVIWGKRVFLTGADADAREVYCLDADTGSLLWRANTDGVQGAPKNLPDVLDDTGHAAPSVAVDGQRVVAIFSTGVIAGFDFDGRRLWGRALGIPDNHYGHSASLLIWRNVVYVQFDQFGASVLLALDAETGQTRWQQKRAADTSWTSPILIPAENPENKILVLSAAPMVAAYDATTGAPRWSQDVLTGEIGSSPAYAAGRIFAANEYAQAVALDAKNGDILWTSNALELPDAGSPVATEQYLFMPSTYGVFSCVDTTDGSLIWEQEFPEGGYGSPVLAHDRIYWMTANGQMRIFKATNTYEMIAEPELGEKSHGTPALVGNRIYVRGEQHVFCIEDTP